MRIMTFLIISCLLFIVIAWIIPKRISQAEQYAVILYSMFIGFFVDVLLDLKLHLYGYFSQGIQFAGYLPIIILFPASGILFVNFFPYKKSVLHKSLYVIYWSIFCIIYEFASVKSGYFYHNGWNYWYSAAAYPLLLIFQLINIAIFRKLMRGEAE